MATTAKNIVPDATPKDQKQRKPISKRHKAKLVSALDRWRSGLTDEERAELAERNRQTQKARWDSMSKKEKDARLAGVRAWQEAQRAKKRAEAKAKPASKTGAKKAPAQPSSAASVGESPVPARGRRTRKAVAK